MRQDITGAPLPQPFHLADWQVDSASDRIRRGATEIKLEARMMALLVYLAARPGEVVAREALERDVWNGRLVSYDALTVCIRKLRRTLGDDPRQPRYIETVAKKGYRLIAPVTAIPETVTQEVGPSAVAVVFATKPRRAGAAAMVLAAAALIAVVSAALFHTNSQENDSAAGSAASLPSLAVLPFQSLNADTAHDYLNDGITADITTALSVHSGLFVIAHPSVSEFRNSNVDVTRAADELGVRYVLRGTVQRAGTQLRVNAQLIDAQSGLHLWAERYDRPLQDVLAVQDDIVGRIVSALAVKLTAEEKQRAARRYTVSVDAYDAFLRGQTHFSHRMPDDNLLARAAYEQAVTLDPNFARAYSALALTYTHEFRFGWSADSHAALQRAYTLALKAVELDDALPHAQWVLGHVHLHRHEFDQARQAAQQAIRLNPNFADGYMALANSLIYSEDIAAALPLIRKAMRLNPRYPAQYAEILGQAYYFLDRHEDAVAALRDATERNVNLLPSYVFLAAALSGLGDTDEAQWAIDQLRTLMPGIRSGDVPEMFPIKNATRMATILERLQRAGL